MVFIPKAWETEANPLGPPTGPNPTPVNGPALIDLETRLSTYTDTETAAAQAAAQAASDPAGSAAAAQAAAIAAAEAASVLRDGTGLPANVVNGTADTLINVKGDMLAGTADNVRARIGVGTDGQVLTADAASTPGIKWAAAAGGLLANQVLRVYNVTDPTYGAVGDGVADDTAAIKAAILACAGASIGVIDNPGGGIVFLPQGQYLISSTIEIPDGVRVIGVGPNSGPWPNASGNNLGTRVIAKSTFPIMCPMFALGARLPAVVTTGVTFANSIEYLTVDGQNFATVGIYTNKAQEHSRIDYVTVQKCSMIGVHVATPNGSAGANQTNNFGISNLKAAPTHVNAYKATTLNGAVTVTTGTNPTDAASNYCNPVTTSGQATGTVLVTDTTGFPAAGCVIVTQQSQQAPVVVYYTSVSGNSLVGCYTDATPSQSPSLSIASNAQVETPACGAYVQNVGAMRGIEESTFDSGFASATCVGLRLDGANGVYSKLHCEHVKYGVLMGSASMCAGAEIDHVMLGGDTTVVDLIRVGAAGSSNSQNSFTLRHIMRYVNGPNTINDLSNSNTITDQYVGLYAVGLAGVGLGGSNSLRPIISTSDQVLTNFKKGFAGPVKSGSDFADGDFVNPIDGLSGYRTDNQSFQWRSNGTWHTTSALAPLASPTFTGTPLAPTPSASDSSTKIATTAYADAAVAVEVSRAQTAEALLAPKASPALTGHPTGVTESALDNSTRLASTAYADTAVGVETTRATTAEALKAPIASPTFTGTAAAPTPAVADSSTTLATTAYVPKVSPGPAYNLLPGNFWHWRKAVANARAGLASSKVLVIGDSTSWGKLAGGSNPPFTTAWPARLSSLLNSYHVPSSIGLNTYANPDPADSRWTLGTGWTVSSNNTAGFAGYCINGANSAAGALTFAPGYACDTIDVYYVQNNLGSSVVTVDGGGTLATLTTAGSGAIKKTTVALGSLASNHVISFAGPTGGQFFIVGVDAYDSTTTKVRISLTGVSGSVTGISGQTGSKWLNSSANYNSNGCITAYAPDLSILMLGVNDANGSFSAAGWNTATQSLITLCQASGDVLLVSVVPSSSAGLSSGATGVALEVSYGQQAALLAAANNCGYLDVNSRWGVYATANTNGFMADTEHENGIGHADIAQAIFTALKLI